MADQIGIRISGSVILFWPYPLTSNDVTKRERGLELAGKSPRRPRFGVENVLIVPGAVPHSVRNDHEPVPNDVCDQRAKEAVGQLAKQAEKLKVSLNVENIFFNGYLMTPMEMNQFVTLRQRACARPLRHGNISMFSNTRTLGADSR